MYTYIGWNIILLIFPSHHIEVWLSLATQLRHYDVFNIKIGAILYPRRLPDVFDI